jgi:hypothetical protein
MSGTVGKEEMKIKVRGGGGTVEQREEKQKEVCRIFLLSIRSDMSMIS